MCYLNKLIILAGAHILFLVQRSLAITTSSLTTTASEEQIGLPIIFVAGGAFVDCGAPLIPDSCTTLSSWVTFSPIGPIMATQPITFIWTSTPITQTTLATATFDMTLENTYHVVITTVYSTTVVVVGSFPLLGEYVDTTSVPTTSMEIRESTWTAPGILELTENTVAPITYTTMINQSYVLLIVTSYPTRHLYYFPANHITGNYIQTITHSPSSLSSWTDRNMQTAYKPSVLPTKYLVSAAAMSDGNPSTMFAVRSVGGAGIIDSPDPKSMEKNRSISKDKRSYDYNYCDASPPSHDFVSNDAVEVCHFVANIKNRFVTMNPTSAAYMPSWGGFVIQVAVSVWNLLSLVSSIVVMTIDLLESRIELR